MSNPSESVEDIDDDDNDEVECNLSKMLGEITPISVTAKDGVSELTTV